MHGGQSVDDALSAKHTADQGVSSSNNAESKYYNNIKPNQDISHEFDNIGQCKIVRNPIPNSGNAKIDPRKLTEYALNPNHPVGGNKAKVFDSALGYNQSNADDLIRQIHTQLPDSEAVLGKLDEYGQRYTVDMLIKGPNGNTATVRTGWIIKNGSDNPELTTLWVND